MRNKSRYPSTHFTWSIELGDKCPHCGGDPLLVVAIGEMKVDEGDPGSRQQQYAEELPTVDIEEEISGHWCPECERMVSLSFNGLQNQ